VLNFSWLKALAFAGALLLQSRISAPADEADFQGVAALGREYSALQEAKGRLDFTIKCTDARVIDIGTSVATLRSLFGNALEVYGGEGEEPGTALVLFSAQFVIPKSVEPSWQVPIIGWYLRVHMRHGKVTDYYLTNIHK
jgi:hypothetical protein